ncbi:hypothetical protein [Streptomyces flaveolus]
MDLAAAGGSGHLDRLGDQSSVRMWSAIDQFAVIGSGESFPS